jgi:hypothetical protein
MMLARQSAHRFPTPALENAALIYNYLPTDTRSPSTTGIFSQQAYYFTFKYTTNAAVDVQQE